MILPDAIILQIVLESDFRTLKALRLVSQYFHSLIGTYERSISAQILQRLHSGPILDHFALGHLRHQSFEALYEIDRRVTFARWLAWVSVKNLLKIPKDPPGVYHYPKAAMPVQDVMEHIALGLGLIWHLSDKAKQRAAAELQKPFMPPGTYSRATRGHRNWHKLEEDIQMTEYLHYKNLSESSHMNLYYAIQFCAMGLGDRPPTWIIEENLEPPCPPPTPKVPTSRGISCRPEHPGRRELVRWLIIREGPDFIAQAWRTSQGNAACTKLVDEEQAQRSENQRTFEHGAVDAMFYSMDFPKPKRGDKYYGSNLARPAPIPDDDAMSLWAAGGPGLEWSYDPKNLTV
ncbi:hypothetical protein BCR34DRAFT_567297 [Clohesyomyces aquaticus]|uniref:F-box domain-containing protein n=1 Tax=Clohesyomyces aquaticus TaxID=1231657 RepID=A0A1Y1ZJ34_9PLEO|nr:hypothetical protein BCR34DRAFT_567297 [Clohesyomyces aquaticus]